MKKILILCVLLSMNIPAAQAFSFFNNRRQVVIINNVGNPTNPQKCVQPTGYVGHPITVLQGITFPFAVRVIRPGDMMTMDFNPNRLSIFLNEKDIMTEVRCG
jgi:Peptidase inhibitor I78 family